MYTQAHFNDNLVREKPDFWEESCWRETYGFLDSAAGCIQMRNDASLGAQFCNPMHNDDGFRVEHCANAWECRLLRFLAPDLNPQKSAFVTY